MRSLSCSNIRIVTICDLFVDNIYDAHQRLRLIELVAKIPNEAIVLRGGRNRPKDIRCGIGTHPSGVTGISVECGKGYRFRNYLHPSRTGKSVLRRLGQFERQEAM
jgi:hypothetical protein